MILHQTLGGVDVHISSHQRPNAHKFQQAQMSTKFFCNQTFTNFTSMLSQTARMWKICVLIS